MVVGEVTADHYLTEGGADIGARGVPVDVIDIHGQGGCACVPGVQLADVDFEAAVVVAPAIAEVVSAPSVLAATDLVVVTDASIVAFVVAEKC